MFVRQARDGVRSTNHDLADCETLRTPSSHRDVLLPGVCVSISVNSLYASPRQKYRDYVVSVKREFRRVSQLAMCFQSHPWLCLFPICSFLESTHLLVYLVYDLEEYMSPHYNALPEAVRFY